MKKSVELLEKIENVKNEISVLRNNGELDKAHAKLEEIKNLRAELEVERELEVEDVKNITLKPVDMAKVEAKNINKEEVFNSAVKKSALSKVKSVALTEAENNILSEQTGADGGYLLPVGFINEIELLKRQYLPLKQYCRILPVSVPTGSMPLGTATKQGLIDFTSGTDIAQADISFEQVAWNLKTYGQIIPISSNLLEDQTLNLPAYIGYEFAKSSVLSENAKILSIMANAKAVSGADYNAITQALNKELDPAISANAKIFTNQDGFDYLDTLEDKFGRPLLNVSLADATKKMYKGREIVVLSNAHMPSIAGKLTFYVGDMSQAIAFFDRGVLEMASSVDAGFTTNTVLTRIVERFDVASMDSEAMVCVNIPVSSASASTATASK